MSICVEIGKLERTTMQDNESMLADLEMLSIEELEVLRRVLVYTLEREGAASTGKRLLLADPSGLSADDMVIYRRMVARAEVTP